MSEYTGEPYRDEAGCYHGGYWSYIIGPHRIPMTGHFADALKDWYIDMDEWGKKMKTASEERNDPR